MSKVLNRGKVVRIGRAEWPRSRTTARYRDVDGDGVPYRTLPGSRAWTRSCTGGLGMTRDGIHSEEPEVYRKLMMRLEEED